VQGEQAEPTQHALQFHYARPYTSEVVSPRAMNSQTQVQSNR